MVLCSRFVVACTTTLVMSCIDAAQCNAAQQGECQDGVDDHIDAHISLLQDSISLKSQLRDSQSPQLADHSARMPRRRQQQRTSAIPDDDHVIRPDRQNGLRQGDIEALVMRVTRAALGEHGISLLGVDFTDKGTDAVERSTSMLGMEHVSRNNTSSKMSFGYEKVKKSPHHLAPLAAVVTACLTMLTIGGDDVIWLLPFFIGNDKVTKTVFYIFYMEIVVFVSWALKDIMVLLERHHPNCPIRKIIQVVSSICLTLFCAYLFMEWMNEDDEEDDEPIDEPNGLNAKNLEESAWEGTSRHVENENIVKERDACTNSQTVDHQGGTSHLHNEHHERLGLWMLFVVSMVGSMDNFAVFSYLLFAEIMTGVQLFLGVLLASSIIAAVTHGALAFKPLLRLVEKMPLWVIFACLSIWSYTEIVRD